ncbi:glutathione peroxidase [Hyphobacterium sp. CCMP332]|nr:glutathione peroxidase [Hyphobacterium sp. CCMP332]
MKKISFLYLVFVLFTACFNKSTSRPGNMSENNSSDFYSFKLKSIEGDLINFSKYQGKKVMLVNVASKCGYTPQYAELQELHEKHGDRVVILGFPANNFGSQEPGNNSEIALFCRRNYGVEFQMFEKISVKGVDMHPLYQWLSTKELNGWNEDAPNWNFCKYLVNEKGELTHFFQSGVKPMGDKILNAIKE